MQIIDGRDFGLLSGVLMDESPATKQAAMSALLRGQQPQQFSPQPFPQAPPQQPQAPQQGGASGSWDAPQQPRQPRLKQALAAQAQRAPVGPAAAPAIPPVPQAPPMDDFATRDAALQKQYEAALGEMSKATQPGDPAAMNAYAKQRQEQGSNQLMLALAAQHAGDGYKGLQGHFLKQAADADEPIKMHGGTVTSAGWLEDPSYRQTLAVRQGEARIASIERAQAANISAVERRRLEQDKQQAAADVKNATLGLQAQIANQASADRRYMADLSHADRQAAAAAKAGAGGGKILPAKMVADMTADEQKAGQFANLSKEFRPEYAGAEGTAMKLVGNVGGLVGADTKSSEWWRNYKKEAELVERHGLFGASLTEGEKAAWREADISPTMHPDAIARNLQRRAQILVDKHRFTVSRLGASGYNVEGFPLPDQPQAPAAPAGGAARVSSDADYAKLPSGAAFVGPDGKARRKP